MKKYNPEIIEKKWQNYWAEKRIYKSKEDKTKRKFYPNIKEVSLKSEILKRNIKVKLSARALKAVDFKGGLDEYLLKAKNKNLSPKIKKLRKIIISKNK